MRKDDQESKHIAFWDWDNRLKQIQTADVSFAWGLSGRETIWTRGEVCSRASRVLQAAGNLWLLRADHSSRDLGNYSFVVRISPQWAAEYLIASDHDLPDELKPYATPVPDNDPTREPIEASLRKGRRPATDSKKDRTICERWRASGCKTYEEFCRQTGTNREDLKAAIARQRSRKNRLVRKPRTS